MLSQQAYEYIKDKIVRGDLAASAQVSELSLANQIGISRTPVRQAIHRLANEGLLEQVPRYGTVVRTLDRRGIIELYELREALEGWSAAEAATRINPSDLQLLIKLCEQMHAIERELVSSGKHALDADQLRRFLMVDMAFHTVQIRATGNQRIIKIISENLVLTRIFCTHRQAHTTEVVSKTCEFHQSILDAIRASDPVASRRHLVEHIRDSGRQALEAFDQRHMEDNVDGGIVLDLPEELLNELNGIGDASEAETGGASP